MSDNKEKLVRERLAKERIVPVIALPKPEDALLLCEALLRGGISVAEITFRTAGADKAIALVAKEFPDMLLGAGTVTQIDELERAIDGGARFAVAPGLSSKIVRRAQALGLPFFPGVCTPTEIEAALECDCRILKFFPAGAVGGVKLIKALHAPYNHRGVEFVPTGGITADNLAEYLTCPGVIAIGGSWMVETKLLKDGNWAEVERLSREAREKVSAL